MDNCLLKNYIIESLNSVSNITFSSLHFLCLQLLCTFSIMYAHKGHVLGNRTYVFLTMHSSKSPVVVLVCFSFFGYVAHAGGTWLGPYHIL